MNFTVIENPAPKHLEKYDEFIELYNQGDLIINDIIKKLGWSQKTYLNALKQGRKEGKIGERRLQNAKYYYPADFGYRITKWLNGKRVHFGWYGSEEAAKLAVEYFKECGWDKSQIGVIRERVFKELDC